jgi:hypothetical protein
MTHRATQLKVSIITVSSNLCANVQCDWGGNNPHVDEGYYHGQSCGELAHNFFAVLVKVKDTFVKPK